MISRRVKLLSAFATPAMALLVTGCVGVSNALLAPVERTVSLQLSALPSDTEPVRIALLSDVHVGDFVITRERLRTIVADVNRADPDIVLLAGDFVIGHTRDGAAERAENLAPLAGLQAPQGVFAVLGNHDHWTNPEAIRAQLRKAGVTVLANDAVRIGPLAIVGIDDRFSAHDDIARSLRAAEAAGGIPIAFSHSPDLAHDLPASVPVLLAGHTHCGQVVVPWIGPIVRYSRGRRLYDPSLRCGLLVEPSRTVIVTGGIGSGTVPMRFGAPADWWLVELTPKRPHIETMPFVG